MKLEKREDGTYLTFTERGLRNAYLIIGVIMGVLVQPALAIVINKIINCYL